MNDADASTIVLVECPEVDRVSAEAHFGAVVGLDVSGEQLDQRRLAGTVLADECVDLTRAHLEMSAVESDLPRVGLGELADVENQRGARITPGPSRSTNSVVTDPPLTREGSA